MSYIKRQTKRVVHSLLRTSRYHASPLD